MNHTTLQAGAGLAPVRLDNGCLPLDGFIGTHDDLHVRVLLLEEAVRFALVSIEITSIFDDTRDRFRDLASRALDTAPGNVWITLTHSFCGPHIWPAPKEGKPDGPGGQHDPETVRKCRLLEDAYCAALEEASRQALASMTEATVGWGTGSSAVNVSRNLPTDEGWWLGSNPETPCDHSLHVLRVDRADGTPLALLYNLGIRPCVTSGIRNPDGTGLISGDISGVTSTRLEQEFGHDFVAIFLCGAAGDQWGDLSAACRRLPRRNHRFGHHGQRLRQMYAGGGSLPIRPVPVPELALYARLGGTPAGRRHRTAQRYERRIVMNHVIKMTCLTENYPDGQKIYGVCLSYDKPIAPDLSLADAYQVENRTVCGVSVQGCDVILSLDLKDKAAAVILQPDSMPEGKKHLKKDGEEQPEAEKKPRKPLDTVPASKVVRVLQTADITAADGTVIAPDGQWGASTEVDEPLICRFQQKQYQGVNYNLYLPEGYDPAQHYPLVVFIHDAGVRGRNPKITLMQGNGALTWAKPEWQAKHPCIVVAPQVSQNSDKEIDTVKGLIDSIRATYSVDEKRIYATGQSMGCMTFCEMNIQYPDYFTASLPVAGQWDADRMAEACTGCKFWILVSNHDERAFPGMNAVVDALERKGVTFGRHYWDAKLPPQTLNRLAAQAAQDAVDMRYTVFDGSSVVPTGKNDNPVTNHVCTWPTVYEIDGVKEWLFSCVKD